MGRVAEGVQGMTRLFICNGKNDKCKKTHCAWKQDEGGCFHTANEEYALNPEGERRFESMENWEEWETMTRKEFCNRIGLHSFNPYYVTDDPIDEDFIAFVAGLLRIFEDLKR